MWARFFFFLQLIGYANLCYASERSEVDPVNREMILKTHNVSILFLFHLLSATKRAVKLSHFATRYIMRFMVNFFAYYDVAEIAAHHRFADLFHLTLLVTDIKAGFSAARNWHKNGFKFFVNKVMPSFVARGKFSLAQTTGIPHGEHAFRYTRALARLSQKRYL